MRKIILSCIGCILSLQVLSQQSRNIHPNTLEKTYAVETIHSMLRQLVNQADKTSYFKDEFFNAMLRRIVLDGQFTAKEKVQIFYLMQKKIGYAFSGVDYLPPELNYFMHHSGKIQVFRNSSKALKGAVPDPRVYLDLVDTCFKKDPIIASNALLLATILNGDSAIRKMEQYSVQNKFSQAGNPAVFLHYLCLSASLAQNDTIAKHLRLGLMNTNHEEMLEDMLCALYSSVNHVTIIRDYILSEKDKDNELAIQTALCALSARVPEASYKVSLKTLIGDVKEAWKKELCEKMLNNKIPFNYALTNKDQLVLKIWHGVNATVYTDGVYILNGEIMEFDPN